MSDPRARLAQNGSPPVDGLKELSSRVSPGLTWAWLRRWKPVDTPVANVGSEKRVISASIERVAIRCFIRFSTSAVVSYEYRFFARCC